MATPPTHIYHSMSVHEALMAVHSSYGYGLLARYTCRLIFFYIFKKNWTGARAIPSTKLLNWYGLLNIQTQISPLMSTKWGIKGLTIRNKSTESAEPLPSVQYM